MSISEIDQHDWSIDALNKAYRQGYLFGLSGEPERACPYQSEVIAAAWEAGVCDTKSKEVQSAARRRAASERRALAT